MIYKKIKSFTALILGLALCISLCGCGGSYDENAVIYINLSASPVTLDPQLAESENELIITRNLFEGLMRYTPEGELGYGVAESHTQNGLTYTFKLKKDLLWSNGDPLTAQDFLFGIKRALNKNTNAPFASELFCISGAESIYNGQADLSALGVTANDDYMLTFTLREDNPLFLHSLAKAVFMPCHSSFFCDTNGQYGLNDDSVVSNGSYKLRSWDTETKTVKLSRNSNYKGEYTAQNYSVVLTNSKEENVLLLENENIDTALLSFDEFKNVELYNCISLENTVWFLMFNKNNEKLSDPTIRQALIKCIDFESLSEPFEENSLTRAFSFIPNALTEKIDGYKADNSHSFNPNEAQRLYQTATLNKKIVDLKLVYIEGMQKTANSFASTWQQHLGAVVNTFSAHNLRALKSIISATDYDIALVPFSAVDTDFYNYESAFTSDNYYGFNYPAFDNAVSAHRGNNFSKISAADILEAQSKLLSDYTLYPVAASCLGIASTSKIIEQNFSLTQGYMDFAYFTKS